MAAEKTQRQAALTDSISSFSSEAAMQLVQAFYQELDLDALLTLFQRQAQALTSSTGLRYECEPQGLNRSIGITRKHNVRYNLQWPERDLGSLTLFFAQPAPEHALQTIEDLIALMAGALNNALDYSTANQLQAVKPRTSGERSVARALAAVPKSDSLVLVALDNFSTIQEDTGALWAQSVLDSVQAVLTEALREADGVFQIREGLLAVLLPGTHQHAAAEVAQKICVLIGTIHLSCDQVGEQLTACMGIASSREGDDAASVLARAEQRLTQAQKGGPGSISR